LKEHHVVFNSLDNQQGDLYFGVWGDASGSLEWKSWKILVRADKCAAGPGAPCVVQGYTEGKITSLFRIRTWAMIRGPANIRRGISRPSLRRKTYPTGRVFACRVSSGHHFDGQVACCPCRTEDDALLADEAQRMKAAWHAPGYMMAA